MQHALDILGEEGDIESEAAGNGRWAILADLAGVDPTAWAAAWAGGAALSLEQAIAEARAGSAAD